MGRNRQRPGSRRGRNLGFVRLREPAANAAWWLLTAAALYGAYRAGRYLAYGPETGHAPTVPVPRDVYGVF